MASPSAAALLPRLLRVRARSEALIAGLEPEDLCLQGMADASPAKWHLGHTTWFFAEFLLGDPQRSGGGHEPADPRWRYLFNSYYEAVGPRQPRPQRGLLTRPAIAEVLAWRQRVTEALAALVERLEAAGDGEGLALVELGLQHEQQHQELLLMDLLDGFSRNPLEPAAFPLSDAPAPATGDASAAAAAPVAADAVVAGAGAEHPELAFARSWSGGGAEAARIPSSWLERPGGLVEIGHPGGSGGPGPSPGGFHFDNEAPRHRLWLEPFALASRLVSNGDYAAFIADGGYRRPELWMSEGWAVVQQRGWSTPRYWRGEEEFTLAGLRPRPPEAPVRHLSWFEADAYARWAGARLPSEAEWELAAAAGLALAYGCLWQWTASPYRPYPGFAPAAGAVGEYNGKFMTSQFVLRGSCFLTPAGHERLTYRNFYPPAGRWMAAGLRLARDV
jgi:formylglycine-generating enzyme required for sulfatase activity